MEMNTINTPKNKNDSSLINTVNIHDTPSLIKYKYLNLLKNTTLKGDNESVADKKVSLHCNSTEDKTK